MKFKTNSYPSQCSRRPVILIIIVARCKKKNSFAVAMLNYRKNPKFVLNAYLNYLPVWMNHKYLLPFATVKLKRDSTKSWKGNHQWLSYMLSTSWFNCVFQITIIGRWKWNIESEYIVGVHQWWKWFRRCIWSINVVPKCTSATAVFRCHQLV